MGAAMWGSRFRKEMDPEARRFQASLAFDRRLALQDVRASAAWARALALASAISQEDRDQILSGLARIEAEFGSGEFAFQDSDEDIHTAVERRLIEIVGEAGGVLHTGRSRNDQVAADLRLWLLDHLPHLDRGLADLQTALLTRAEAEARVLMPGYTHLQRAQPILLGHWWLSHFWPLQRDREHLRQVRQRTAQLPLGSGALAGTAYPIDRDALAADLGFDSPSPNSLDAVSDRDFAAEFLFVAALTSVHLSRLAEAVVLFSSEEFGFFELADAYGSGSSLMPQKKNPDVFELARGKAGTMIGSLAGFLATLKALPSAYDKDLQEDKLAVFGAYDALSPALPVLAGAIRSLSIRPVRMSAGLDGHLLATDLADYLVEKGVPFRQAHDAVGRWVRAAGEQARPLRDFHLEELRAFHPAFETDVTEVFDPLRSVSRRSAIGGTAPAAVRAQISAAHQASAALPALPTTEEE
jgi:argininosuccinate lyase